jgi:hypothetical protein
VGGIELRFSAVSQFAVCGSLETTPPQDPRNHIAAAVALRLREKDRRKLLRGSLFPNAAALSQPREDRRIVARPASFMAPRGRRGARRGARTMTGNPALHRRACLRGRLTELRNGMLDRMLRRGAVEPGTCR